MKRCSKCQIDKPATEFNKHNGKRDRLQPWCRECNRARSRQYYRDNREKHRAVIRKQNDRRRVLQREWVYQYLLRHPCVDCSEDDPIVLDFDHVDGNKIEDIGKMLRRGRAMRVLEAEIAKCEVVCANCHRKRTAATFNWWRHLRAPVTQAAE